MTGGFGDRLRTALDARGPLCVGIDPHAALLDAWGAPQSAEGVRGFALRVVEASAGRVAAVKPQVSFFERFGSRGFAVLEEVLRAARAAGLLVIADAKRGDIGSTNEGYAEAWLAPGSPLESDAVTVSPYLGGGALGPVLDRAVGAGKGVFVLAATSNPEGAELQRALTAGGASVARRVAEDVVRAGSAEGLGPVGLVIGATVDRTSFGLDDELLAGVPILAPGFGAQGAEPEDLARRFGPLARNVLASESRSILSAGPEGIADAIDARVAHYREVLGV
ncbi:orotidine-5'-phosphate decarboxylase [Microbacterium resistens]|uniref:Orotidine 5'-phosphate decarboxylase n=1 Tax=Microbacterium resistens TaxID=156977 RepID=A0ABU1SG08_9MICO|nr:orotidine-5'-phosphate decarboxylase [Microbacterium resistens]MDR6868539.1 orotidine-5'-phosphate decarboxylase [Microbacterium resistens]